MLKEFSCQVVIKLRLFEGFSSTRCLEFSVRRFLIEKLEVYYVFRQLFQKKFVALRPLSSMSNVIQMRYVEAPQMV